jgi:hypothetical protein
MSAYEQLLHPPVLKGVSTATEGSEPKQPLLQRVISRVFVCWHRKLSRPFTRDAETYRVCLRCGMHRHFDLQEWKMKGNYYNPNLRGRQK